MSGKLVGLAILFSALVAGAALYYLQIYGFYKDASDSLTEVRLVSTTEDATQLIAAQDISAIDAESSPIRFRACFTTTAELSTLTAAYQPYESAVPRNAPYWFDCFDAEALAEALKSGTARAFLGEKNVNFGVDRIVAITQDGRGYIWHELNDCGEKAYDGTIIGEECPARPGAAQ